MPLRAFLLAAGLALALPGAGAALTPSPPRQEVTRAELALMVLPKTALGPAAARFTVDPTSGFTTNDDVATASLDLRETVSTIAQAGRIVGYELAYSDPRSSAIAARSGMLDITTRVDLFRTSLAAKRYFAAKVGDRRRVRTGESVPGVRIASSRFAVAGIGDEALGRRASRQPPGKPALFDTAVLFRVGRLHGRVTISRADRADAGAQATALARELAQRMRDVLQGTIAGRPVPLPARTSSGRPVGEPDLARLVLVLGDLPAGAATTNDGYVRDTGAVAAYDRSFDLGDTAEAFLQVDSAIELYRNPLEASYVFALQTATLEAPSSPSYLQRVFNRELADKVSVLRIDRGRTLPLGDEARDYAVLLETQGVRVEEAAVFVRCGRALGSITLYGQPGQTLALAERLAEVMTARMRTGLC